MLATDHNFKVNDVVSAQVTEQVAASEYLVSLDGDLIRVRNTTGHSFNPNEFVLLKVVSVKPLGFQLVSGGVRNFDWHV
jgi:hypothetical protein